ncbi:PLP-dependent transferase [Collinsella stercoris]|uniref:PLP-dependent transferase n=1 Tax=Collinsella stercoris TaxID=147206 RepID=UPI003995B0DA
MLSQLELEARYADAASAATAHFVYAGHVNEAIERCDLAQEGDIVADAIGGAGLCVPNLRELASKARDAGGRLIVDGTVPSHFGCRPLELGAAVALEALDRVAAGRLSRKVVAIASRAPLSFDGVDAVGSDVIDAADLAAIDEGLRTFPDRMQCHVDHARALAEYLACFEGGSRACPTPVLLRIPTTRWPRGFLCMGLGLPSILSCLPAGASRRGEFIECCRLNGRTEPAGGYATRLHARDGAKGYAVRVFAGLDDPLVIAADLDQVLRSCAVL